MVTCEVCKKNFPDYLVDRAKNYSIGYAADRPVKSETQICVGCVLKHINRVHHLPEDTPFYGKKAEALHNRYKEWVKTEWISTGAQQL